MVMSVMVYQVMVEVVIQILMLVLLLVLLSYSVVLVEIVGGCGVVVVIVVINRRDGLWGQTHH